METPQVAVIMSVYNGQEFLAECIESILVQTFADFEFIIVDDASTDNTLSIIKSYAEKDQRIRYLKNDVNAERSFSRNRAASMATADLIAVMDADDVALPDRLEKQITFMQTHEDVAVLGGAMEGHENRQHFSVPFERLPAKLLFNSVIYHPTCMFRKTAFQQVGGYDEDYPLAEDYSLWVRLVQKGHALANIPDVLVRYRIHPGKPRAYYKEALRQSMHKVWHLQFFHLGIEASPLEFDIHGSCASLEQDFSWRVRQVDAWLKKLQKANRQTKYISEEMLIQECEAIQASLAMPLSFTKEPLTCLKRLFRHIFFIFCRTTGELGKSLEKKIRIMKHSIK